MSNSGFILEGEIRAGFRGQLCASVESPPRQIRLDSELRSTIFCLLARIASNLANMAPVAVLQEPALVPRFSLRACLSAAFFSRGNTSHHKCPRCQPRVKRARCVQGVRRKTLRKSLPSSCFMAFHKSVIMHASVLHAPPSL